jgi:hypothetical protein
MILTRIKYIYMTAWGSCKFPISIGLHYWHTRAVGKVGGLTLLLWVGTLCRRGDGLFFEYLPWQVMHFLQRSTHFSKTCCRPLITSKFLASELPLHGLKSPVIEWDEIWIEFCVQLGKSGSMEPHLNIRHTVQIWPHAISGLFQPRKGSSEARSSEVINGLQHVFEKWVERCKKCIACQGRYFGKKTITVPPQIADSE